MAKGRPRAGLFAGSAVPRNALRLRGNATRNKPLMACKQHWKSARVLPTF